jgi:RIO-like serine/threonine protein kinase
MKMQKKDSLKLIKKLLQEDFDVVRAIDVWYSSYQKITVNEFMECSDVSPEYLTQIINEYIYSLQEAKKEIESYETT